ncbi:hypothetical protein VNI00_016005 [Paramarasmius palmivorus]|uniref:Biotrophy-associated secreted protein 2 n=1 Tax=Paramarasmius palmivorus TaxID=297713 RepID=A0AAW0BGV5_9AGAR
MMAKFTVLLALLTINFAAATYIPRQAPGTQFITGPCQSDKDCASDCCGFNSGKCAGPVIAQERDGGCGFGDPQPNDRAARVFRGEAPAAPATPPANNGAGGAAAGSGKLLVLSSSPALAPTMANVPLDAVDSTAESALVLSSHKNVMVAAVSATHNPTTTLLGNSAAVRPLEPSSLQVHARVTLIALLVAVDSTLATLERDGGCGFGDAQPNDNAARKLRGEAPAAPGTPPPANNGAGGAAAGSGKPPGTQFITGPCANDGECASGCCGFNSGKCAGAIIAQERDGGCGFGDAQPNDNAARKLRGQA